MTDWNSDYSVNVGEIDDQHKELFRLISELDEGRKAGKGSDSMSAVLSGLAKYARVHFALEENYFEKFDYSGQDDHKKKHADFIGKVTTFKSDYIKGNANVDESLIKFLNSWLVDHIKGTDHLYIDCFNANGLA